MSEAKAKAAMVVIAAGGTGGHIFPGLAVAEELSRAGVRVAWLGSGGMETTFAQAANIPLYTVPFPAARGVVRLARLAVAVVRAYFLLRRLKPTAVLGMGGYASVPGALAAWLCDVPLVIHEQNAIAGKANRVLRSFATTVLQGFPDVLPGGIWVGNPVRRDFLAKAEEKDAPSPPPSSPPSRADLNVLVLGGSQGARALNEIVPSGLADYQRAQRRRVFVVHQCGKERRAAVAAQYQALEVTATVSEFIDDVATAMRRADVVICRAGAATLAELAMVGAAAALVPYPHAADQHQAANAEFFKARGAAMIVEESSLSASSLAARLQGLNAAALAAMRRAAAALAMPRAAAAVASACYPGGQDAE